MNITFNKKVVTGTNSNQLTFEEGEPVKASSTYFKEDKLICFKNKGVACKVPLEDVKNLDFGDTKLSNTKKVRKASETVLS